MSPGASDRNVMPRVLAIVVFVLLTGEGGLVHTPLAQVQDFLLAPSWLKLPLWTYVKLVLLLVLGWKGRRPRLRAPQMDRALIGSLACVGLWTAVGAFRGGDLHQAGFQTFELINALALAFLIMAVMDTPRHYGMLLDTVVAAAAYRSVVAICAYAFVARHLPPDKVPECMTTHHDSVLFVTGLTILVVSAIERATKNARRLAWCFGPLILFAMHVNNRRLAWVSLVGALATLWVALPPSRSKRRVIRTLACAAPVIALYVGVGWGRSEAVFAPMRALASVSSRENASNRSRDNENDGLVATAREGGWLGAGFGREYIETDTSLSARSSFTQYRFIPHNSLLGLLAFAGVAGVAGILLPLPMSVFLNARTCRVAASPIVRVAAVVGVIEVAICMIQMYGDMGLFSGTTLTILAMAFATAGRLSSWSGAVPTPACRPRNTGVQGSRR